MGVIWFSFVGGCVQQRVDNFASAPTAVMAVGGTDAADAEAVGSACAVILDGV